MRGQACSRLRAGPHPNPLPHAGEGTARCGFIDLRFTSTPAGSAPSPASGRRRGMRVPASSRLPAGPHPDPLPHAGEGTAQCSLQTCTSHNPRSIGPFSRWREKAGDEGASEFLLCALALTLTLSRMREREPFSAVLQTCASPQHPRDRPLLPLAGEGGG